MGILIDKIRIRNFRSLKDVELDLKNNVILMGQNNCGKSNIIRAIELAFSYSYASKADFYVAPNDEYNINKKIIIDVRIIPVSENESFESEVKIEFSDNWTREFGLNINEDNQKQFFAFRTTISYDENSEKYVNNKEVIKIWDDIDEIKSNEKLNRESISAFEVFSIPDQRDISADLRDKNSIWSRYNKQLKIPEENRIKIQKQLSTVNASLIKESPKLKSISEELELINHNSGSKAKITAITQDLESLYKGMDIYCYDKKSCPISVENLGLGIRSWAIFSTIKAEISSRKKSFEEEQQGLYYPIVLIEEPESHIHPQAQRELYSVINEICGQKIITTHSPYIISQVNLSDIIIVKKEGSFSQVKNIETNGLEKEEIRKIKRSVINTRCELLFANAVILAEGETEEQALPMLFAKHFKKEPYELGVTFVNVGGCGSYAPYLQILEQFNIKWVIFSDGEKSTIKAINKALKKTIPGKTVENSDNIIVIDNGDDFEKYFIRKGYRKEIEKKINEYEDDNNYVENFYKKHHNSPKTREDKILSLLKSNKKKYHSIFDNIEIEICKIEKNDKYFKDIEASEVKSLGKASETKAEKLLHCLSKNKTEFAPIIAKAIINCEQGKRMPSKINALFKIIKKHLKNGGK